MFGSLVLVFPTKHEGGSLILRDDGQEWTFDSAQALREHDGPCLGYVAFYSDVEHEVAPVVSGYRVTLTYNLYHADGTDAPPISNALQSTNVELKSAFEALLADPTFLPEGGYLGFGLHREYPLPQQYKKSVTSLSAYNDVLKGGDAELMQLARSLSLDATLNLWYRNKYYMTSSVYRDTMDCVVQGALCSFLPNAEGANLDYDETWFEFVMKRGAKRVGNSAEAQKFRAQLEAKYKGNELRYRLGSNAKPFDIEVCWVTELNNLTRHKTTYMAYGNQASLEFAYGRLCLVVKVGPHGQRRTADHEDIHQ